MFGTIDMTQFQYTINKKDLIYNRCIIQNSNSLFQYILQDNLSTNR